MNYIRKLKDGGCGCAGNYDPLMNNDVKKSISSLLKKSVSLSKHKKRKSKIIKSKKRKSRKRRSKKLSLV